MRSGRSTNRSPIEVKPGMARSILPGIESDDQISNQIGGIN
jgi:hypothetical protein